MGECQHEWAILMFNEGGRVGLPINRKVIGLILGSSRLQVEVSLSKLLNSQLLLVAVPVVCECVGMN